MQYSNARHAIPAPRGSKAARDPPPRADVAALLLLPKAQLAAAIVILTDLAKKAHRFRNPGLQGATIERCARYYVPFGTMSLGVAEVVFPLLMHLLGAEEIDRHRARALQHPVRTLGSGQHYGQFWYLSDPDRPQKLLSELASRGHVRVSLSRHAYADAVVVPSITRGKTRWIVGTCHDDHDPSCQVNASGIVWCYACACVVGLATPEGPDTVRFRRRLPGTRTTETTSHAVGAAPLGYPSTHPPGVLNCRGIGSTNNVVYSMVLAMAAGSPTTWTALTGGGKPTGLRFEDAAGNTTGLREPTARGIVLGRRFGDPNDPRKGNGVFRRSYSTHRDLLDVLRSAQRNLAGPKAQDRAVQADVAHARSNLRDHRHFLPDHYVGLDVQAWTSLREIPKTIHGEQAFILAPDGFESVATRWVGFDGDKFVRAPVNDSTLVEAAKVVERYAEGSPFFSGRVGLVRTSHLGVQVVLELSRTRLDPEAFYADRHVQGVLAAMDAVCLQAVRDAGFEGGHADRTVHNEGRYVRRPGPRKTKQGTVYVSRLVYATP